MTEFSVLHSCSITGKTQKLKRAKEEAQAEIRNYRDEREKQFTEYQREVSALCI